MKKRVWLLVCLVGVSLMLAACGGEEAAPSSDVYFVHNGENTTAVDGDGNVILAASVDSLGLLSDRDTGTARFLVLSEIIGSREALDEYGWAADQTIFSTLYDLSGNVIRERFEGYYTDMKGDLLVLRNPATETADLLNVSTWETVLADCRDIVLLADTIMADVEGEGNYAIYSLEGELIRELSEYTSIYAPNEEYISYTVGSDDLVGLMDSHGNVIMEPQAGITLNIYDDYMVTYGTETQQVYDLTTGEVVFQAAGRIENISGNLLTIYGVPVSGTSDVTPTAPGNSGNLENQSSDREDADQAAVEENPAPLQDVTVEADSDLPADGELGPAEVETTDEAADSDEAGYYLVDFDGNVRSAVYDRLWCNTCPDGTVYYEGFTNQNDAIEHVTVLDSSGTIIFEETVNNGFINVLNNNLLAVQNTIELEDGDSESTTTLYTLSGEQVPVRDYSYVYNMYNMMGEDSEYIIGSYQQGHTSLSDLLDSEGNLILGQFKNIYSCDGKRISASRGFETGLMDMDGNWIYSESIFNSATDETSSYYWY